MENVSELPKLRFTEDGTPLPFTEDEIDALVPLVAHQLAPRRFALCEVVRDPDGQPLDVRVIAWGIQTGLEDDSVSVFGYPDEFGRALRCSFSTADLAARVLAGPADMHLVWVDAEPVG